MWISVNLVCSLSFKNIQLVQKPFVIKQQLPGLKAKKAEACFKNIIILEVVCVWQLHLHLIRNYSIGPYHQESLPRTSKIEGHQVFFVLVSILLSGDLTQKEKTRENLQSKKTVQMVSNFKTRFLFNLVCSKMNFFLNVAIEQSVVLIGRFCHSFAHLGSCCVAIVNASSNPPIICEKLMLT